MGQERSPSEASILQFGDIIPTPSYPVRNSTPTFVDHDPRRAHKAEAGLSSHDTIAGGKLGC